MILRNVLLFLASAVATAASAQSDACKTWETLDAKAKDKAIENHTLYRDQVKAGNFEAAFPLWKAVYEAAPAADGKRSLHYSDGRDIYLAMFQKETDEAKKQEYSDMIMKLYAENHECYPKESQALYSNQVYNMFYVLKRPYEEQYDVLMAAKEMSGDKMDFRMLTPMGYVTTYQYTSENISDAEARQLIEDARKVAKMNMDGPDGDQYKQAMETHDAAVKGIEPYVFDCDYFMPEFQSQYDALSPGDITAREDLVRRMLGANCSRESVAMIGQLDAQISSLRLAEYERNNPMTVANNMLEAGTSTGPSPSTRRWPPAPTTNSRARSTSRWPASTTSRRARRARPASTPARPPPRARAGASPTCSSATSTPRLAAAARPTRSSSASSSSRPSTSTPAPNPTPTPPVTPRIASIATPVPRRPRRCSSSAVRSPARPRAPAAGSARP